MSVISIDEYLDHHFLVFVTTQGLVKRTSVQEFASIRQNGKIAINLRDGMNSST
jgi:DNA gyrase subunit A